MYQLRLKQAARRQLDRLTHQDYGAVAKVISSLQREPRPVNGKKLVQIGLWRVRVGSIRIVYAIDDVARQVTVVKVARRSEDTYKGL